MISWTHFWDMHSGGGCKEAPYEHIFIEAPLEEAVRIFYNRFGHSPYRVSCTCRGEDYSISEYDTLEEATAYQRNDPPSGYSSRPSVTLEEYMFNALKYEALFIAHGEIKETERSGDVPVQGYVWQG